MDEEHLNDPPQTARSPRDTRGFYPPKTYSKEFHSLPEKLDYESPKARRKAAEQRAISAGRVTAGFFCGLVGGVIISYIAYAAIGKNQTLYVAVGLFLTKLIGGPILAIYPTTRAAGIGLYVSIPLGALVLLCQLCGSF